MLDRLYPDIWKYLFLWIDDEDAISLSTVNRTINSSFKTIYLPVREQIIIKNRSILEALSPEDYNSYAINIEINIYRWLITRRYLRQEYLFNRQHNSDCFICPEPVDNTSARFIQKLVKKYYRCSIDYQSINLYNIESRREIHISLSCCTNDIIKSLFREEFLRTITYKILYTNSTIYVTDTKKNINIYLYLILTYLCNVTSNSSSKTAQRVSELLMDIKRYAFFMSLFT